MLQVPRRVNDARRFQGARVHADMTSAPVYEFRGRVSAAAAVLAAPLYRETMAACNGRRALITASPDYGPDAPRSLRGCIHMDVPVRGVDSRSRSWAANSGRIYSRNTSRVLVGRFLR